MQPSAELALCVLHACLSAEPPHIVPFLISFTGVTANLHAGVQYTFRLEAPRRAAGSCSARELLAAPTCAQRVPYLGAMVSSEASVGKLLRWVLVGPRGQDLTNQVVSIKVGNLKGTAHRTSLTGRHIAGT